MRILMIDDDEKLCNATALALKKEKIEVDLCHDGEEGLYLVSEQAHDLILLDCMLPGMDGISILKKIRSEKISTPVIMLTALGDLNDRVTGLDSGADDYLVKPFAFEELMARIRCIIRRPGSLLENTILSCGNTMYDCDKHLLSCGEKTCTLSKRESALTEYLFRYADQSLPRERLLAGVWGLDSDVENGNLDNYVYFIRRRLKSIGSDLTLQTIRGVGYSLHRT